MLILIDGSKRKIEELIDKFEYDKFGQLRTPLTRYHYAGLPYAIDNGAFTKFDHVGWMRIVQHAFTLSIKPIFVTMPDIVGNARRTIELYKFFSKQISGLPRALVLQDGIENIDIPWIDVDAVFVGGSDRFKSSDIAIDCCKTARILGKWVHVGRVNSINRLRNYIEIAQSIDGSGISQYDHMISDIVNYIKNPKDELPIMKILK